MTKDDLKNWWFRHAEIIKNLPGLKWYTILFPLYSSEFDKPPAFDGYEQLWFDSLDELKKAFDCDIMKRASLDMKKNKLDEPSLFRGFWLEENIITMMGINTIPANNMVRQTGLAKRPSTMTEKGLKDWFYNHAMEVMTKEGFMTIPGIKWYTHCFSIDNSPFGTPSFDGVGDSWWCGIDKISNQFNVYMKAKASPTDRRKIFDIHGPDFFWGVIADEFIIDINRK
ncbi:MAG: EthD family reductase [Actinobacteria bacterium]|nr:EthD family reductase [Actinomycetota bacterium]